MGQPLAARVRCLRLGCDLDTAFSVFGYGYFSYLGTAFSSAPPRGARGTAFSVLGYGFSVLGCGLDSTWLRFFSYLVRSCLLGSVAVTQVRSDHPPLVVSLLKPRVLIAERACVWVVLLVLVQRAAAE